MPRRPLILFAVLALGALLSGCGGADSAGGFGWKVKVWAQLNHDGTATFHLKAPAKKSYSQAKVCFRGVCSEHGHGMFGGRSQDVTVKATDVTAGDGYVAHIHLTRPLTDFDADVHGTWRENGPGFGW